MRIYTRQGDKGMTRLADGVQLAKAQPVDALPSFVNSIMSIQDDAAQLDEHPLRVGLSMVVDVDIQQQDGKLLADATRKEPVVQTQVYELQEQGADAVVAQVIADNAGKHL